MALAKSGATRPGAFDSNYDGGEGFEPCDTPGFSTPSPNFSSPITSGVQIPGMEQPTGETVEQMDFVLQFVWKPTALEERPETDPALEATEETDQPTE